MPSRGTFGHPLPQRRLQRQRCRGRCRGPELLQTRSARVVDYQVRVVRVPGVGVGALAGQLGLQGIPEALRVARYPGLGAECGQQLRAPRGADQLVGPVRIHLSAVHSDVPGAQLLGQIRQHTRLQVAAHEIHWLHQIGRIRPNHQVSYPIPSKTRRNFGLGDAPTQAATCPVTCAKFTTSTSTPTAAPPISMS
jgi:hypothetical protein